MEKKQKSKSFFRILIVEDDPDRLRIIQSWMPPDVIVSSVTDTGAAMGQIKKDHREKTFGEGKMDIFDTDNRNLLIAVLADLQDEQDLRFFVTV